MTVDAEPGGALTGFAALALKPLALSVRACSHRVSAVGSVEELLAGLGDVHETFLRAGALRTPPFDMVRHLTACL